MSKLVAAILAACLALTGCTAGSDSTDSTAGLPASDIFLDEGGPNSPNELIAASSVIAEVTLTNLLANPELRGGPNEDESGAEFIELVDLVFEVTKTYKGEPGREIILDFWAYEVENVDGKPGDRVATLTVQGVAFDPTDVGGKFLLFLTDADADLIPVNITNGIARILPNGDLTATSSSGFLRVAQESAEVSELIAGLSTEG